MGGKQDKESKSGMMADRDSGSSRKNGFKLKKHFSRSNSTNRHEMSSRSRLNLTTTSSPQQPLSMVAAVNVTVSDTINKNVDKVQPPRYPELFENEKDSDVTFLVGVEPNIWRLPAHKFVLVAANPVFAAMLKGPMSSKDNKEEVPIDDLDPKAFENVLRFLYTNDLKLTSTDLSLATLFAAEKYMIPELIQLCLQHLDVNLASNNVLSVYPPIRFLALSRQNQLPESFTSLVSNNNKIQTSQDNSQPNNHLKQQQKQQQPVVPANPYIPLLNRCLEHIDRFADHVLSLEDFEGLSEAELSDIVFRDSLQVKSELNVFKALQMWATQQCKCKQKEMTGENKRKVLGSSLYAVRYLLMSKENYMTGPYISDLLNDEEKNWFFRRIEGHTECEPPHHIADRKRYLERRRGQQMSPNATKSNVGREQESQANNNDRNCPSKRCCRVTRIFTEVFLCFSLFFD
ncbi:hypothetical protein CHUAL_004576 [Chamberlinius hualienensis]